MWNVLIPAVILPALLFIALYLYPFFEKWVTADLMEHHLCDRPRDRPTRTALGVAAIVFYGVLLMAGGNDVIAYSFHVSVSALTWIFRVAVLAGPVIAFLTAKRICLALQAHDRRLLEEGEETGRVSQDVSGGISESNRPISVEHRYRLMVREIPKPLAHPGTRVPRRRRLRAALSAWYYRDRVDMPTTAEERLQITGKTAGPMVGPEE
jgi:ubiquinol-cytochrome c reductase cytochrome b subunit